MVDRWNRIYHEGEFIALEEIEDLARGDIPPTYYPACIRQIFDGIMWCMIRFTDLGCEDPPNDFVEFCMNRIKLSSRCFERIGD